MVAVGIVFGGRSDADLDVGHAATGMVDGGEGAEAGGHGDGVGVGDGVADEVGPGGLLGGIRGGGGAGRLQSGLRGGTKRCHGAGELGLHGVDEDGVCGSGGRIGWRCAECQGGDRDESRGEGGQSEWEQREMSCQVDPLCWEVQDVGEPSVADRKDCQKVRRMAEQDGR